MGGYANATAVSFQTGPLAQRRNDETACKNAASAAAAAAAAASASAATRRVARSGKPAVMKCSVICDPNQDLTDGHAAFIALLGDFRSAKHNRRGPSTVLPRSPDQHLIFQQHPPSAQHHVPNKPTSMARTTTAGFRLCQRKPAPMVVHETDPTDFKKSWVNLSKSV
ncbi:Protein of unknown function [Gryllus bimaculatus]|nr:Protein of unknown function [Gryllus bimaculatus]